MNPTSVFVVTRGRITRAAPIVATISTEGEPLVSVGLADAEELDELLHVVQPDTVMVKLGRACQRTDREVMRLLGEACELSAIH